MLEKVKELEIHAVFDLPADLERHITIALVHCPMGEVTVRSTLAEEVSWLERHGTTQCGILVCLMLLSSCAEVLQADSKPEIVVVPTYSLLAPVEAVTQTEQLQQRAKMMRRPWTTTQGGPECLPDPPC